MLSPRKKIYGGGVSIDFFFKVPSTIFYFFGTDGVPIEFFPRSKRRRIVSKKFGFLNIQL